MYVSDYVKELNNIKNSIIIKGNVDSVQFVSSQYANMFLNSFINNKNPMFHEHDFSNPVIAMPNFTKRITNSFGKTIKTEGYVFTVNASLFLELHSTYFNLKGNYYITEKEAKNMGLDKDIKYGQLVSLPISKNNNNMLSKEEKENNDYFINNKFLNVFSLMKPNGPYSGKDINKIFPDLKNQNELQKKYSEQFNNKIKANSNSFNQIQEHSNIIKKHSIFEKLTEEIYHYNICRSKGIYYTPLFSKEEHMKDIIEKCADNPKLFESALAQAGWNSQKAINIQINNIKNIVYENYKDNKNNKDENKLVKYNILTKNINKKRKL